MIRPILFYCTAIACILLPIWVGAVSMLLYGLYYRSVAVCVLAICIDWYLQPHWPLLTVLTLVLVVILPFLKTRLMLYNGH